MRTLWTVAMLLGAATLAGAQDRLADQLKDGIVREEANQDTEKAIETYRAIVAQYDEDRKAAATALYRLAECYRKAGMRAEAQAAYQRVVREFAEQSALADSSRRQLMDAFGASDPRGARESQELLKAQQELAISREALSAAQARQILESRSLLTTSEQMKRPMSVDEARLELEMLERRIADTKARVDIGVASTATLEEMKTQYAKDATRYEALLEEHESTERDRQASLTLNQQTLKSVQAEMRVVEQQIQSMQKKVDAGLVSPADPALLQLQRDLRALQRKADEISAAVKK
jgi:tetratricopeptide (TPR) repeat protein